MFLFKFLLARFDSGYIKSFQQSVELSNNVCDAENKQISYSQNNL